MKGNRQRLRERSIAYSFLVHKFYARGVGNVLPIGAKTGDRVELIQIKTE